MTLLEVLVAMTIVVILFGVGVPAFRSVTTSNRIAGEINGLLGDLMFARVQAIRSGQSVTACASANATACAGTTDWSTGWIVFNDVNGNGTVDPGEAVLRTQARLTGGDTLQADNAISRVTFNREGFALGLPGTVTVTLHEATPKTATTRCLQVGIVGTVAVVTTTTAGCT